MTAFTIGIEDTPETMAARAKEASIYPILKIKVDQDRPVERLAAIRAARPDADLMIDANQGWTFEQLLDVSPKLAEMGVKLIEQPLPRGKDQSLEGYRSPIPLCADESCQHRGELDQACRRYQIINIKLDKAGGLTEALMLAYAAEKRGLQLYVGNMGGTSLSIAPAFVLAQLCHYVELDGPLLLKYDRFPALHCEHGKIAVPDPQLWG
jgi:L-alanine-DL-glutamate epimerase-like enolase superfamily enzyme